ncbi:phage tail tube protein [Moraxella boevrei]|uniref:phage tail tube protein n=1 Tax=Faucicola boevrei TaxID=346665 RepID=UPI003735E53B
MSFGFMGAGYETATTAFATSPTVSKTEPKASTISVESITIDGENLKGIACVTEFNFELDNGMERQNCIGSGLYGAKNLEMMANMTGSLTLAYSQKAQSIVNKQLTGATIAITAVIAFTDGSKYTLNIPKAQISGDIPSGGANEILKAQLNYTVVEIAPTLTRTIV